MPAAHSLTKLPMADLLSFLESNPDKSTYALAKELSAAYGLSFRSIEKRIAKTRASLAEIPVPEGHVIKRVTALQDEDGKAKLRWVRSEPEKDAFFKIAREYVEALCAKMPRAPKREPKTTGQDPSLLTNYVIGDSHFGSLSWHEETGTDYDLQIATELLCGAMDRLVASSPKSKTCMIAQMGDYYHVDSSSPLTPANKNVLDTDSRYLKMVRVGIQGMRYLIDRALDRHEIVRVRNVPGNHDPHAHVALTLALEARYEDEPRVMIEGSPQAFWWFQFGKNLVGLTHGHQLRKPEDMAMFLAVEAQSAWSECAYRYVWQGHVHHVRAKEHGGVVVEAFRTLAGPDYWHASHGYKAGRDMKSIVLHEDFGEVERHTASIDRIQAAP